MGINQMKLRALYDRAFFIENFLNYSRQAIDKEGGKVPPHDRLTSTDSIF